jgi:hypothetical protein
MAPPAYNPNGINPGYSPSRGLEAYADERGQAFAFDSGSSEWRWTFQSALFELRPGLVPAMGLAGVVAPYPINHEAALGLNIYLNVCIYSVGGLVPPAAWPNLNCYYWEDGSTTTADRVFRITQEQNVTDTMQAGGTQTTEPTGASNLNFTPPVGMRFWRLNIRLSIPGVVGTRPATDFAARLSLH